MENSSHPVTIHAFESGITPTSDPGILLTCLLRIKPLPPTSFPLLLHYTIHFFHPPNTKTLYFSISGYPTPVKRKRRKKNKKTISNSSNLIMDPNPPPPPPPLGPKPNSIEAPPGADVPLDVPYTEAEKMETEARPDSSLSAKENNEPASGNTRMSSAQAGDLELDYDKRG
jgi:hypothetical protein